MVRQPLYEVRNDERESALTEHEQLVQVLAETGIGVVRARRALAARQRAEKADPRRYPAPLIWYPLRHRPRPSNPHSSRNNNSEFPHCSYGGEGICRSGWSPQSSRDGDIRA